MYMSRYIYMQAYINVYATLWPYATQQPLNCSCFPHTFGIQFKVSCRQEQNSKRLEEISKLDTEAWEPWNILELVRNL